MTQTTATIRMVSSLTIPALVSAAARRYGAKDALVDGDKRYSFAELERQMYASARAAAAAGTGPGDRVGIWAPNSAAWIVAALGVQARGAAIVPLTTRFRGAEASYVLRTSQAKHVFTVRGFLGIDYPGDLRRADPGLSDIPIVLLAGQARDGETSWESYLGSTDGIDVEAERRLLAKVSPDTVSDVMFTSGTTGAPKGVLTTHRQNLLGWADYARCMRLAEDDKSLIVLPLSHNFGFKAGFVSSVMFGACSVTLDVFDEQRVMSIIEAEGITVLSGTPTLLQGVLGSPLRSRYDLSSLRKGTVAGATVPVELVRRLREESILPRVMSGYGLSEAAAAVSLSEPDDDPETVAATCGRVRDHVRVRVVDEQLRDLPADSEGEILVQAPTVMQGYYNSPEETARAIDKDGWLHTGDIGTVSARGYLKITGRQKDMFIVGGFNAYPAEIELALAEHEGVSDAAVVGVPDTRLGEVGTAFIVPARDTRLTTEDLTEWSRRRLANYKVPRYFEFVTELPRNALLKVDKVQLRERALGMFRYVEKSVSDERPTS
jgi:HIP---CoA ligase